MGRFTFVLQMKSKLWQGWGGERSLSSVKLLIIRVVLVSARRCSDVLCEAGDKRTRRSLARHLSAVSSSFLSSIVVDHLAEADCVSTFF